MILENNKNENSKLINEFVPVKRDDFKKSIVINKVNQYHLN
jgi:hypothetical protein